MLAVFSFIIIIIITHHLGPCWILQTVLQLFVLLLQLLIYHLSPTRLYNRLYSCLYYYSNYSSPRSLLDLTNSFTAVCIITPINHHLAPRSLLDLTNGFTAVCIITPITHHLGPCWILQTVLQLFVLLLQLLIT